MKSGFFDKAAMSTNRSGKVRYPPGAQPPSLTSSGDFPSLPSLKTGASSSSLAVSSPYSFAIPDAVQLSFEALEKKSELFKSGTKGCAPVDAVTTTPSPSLQVLPAVEDHVLEAGKLLPALPLACATVVPVRPDAVLNLEAEVLNQVVVQQLHAVHEIDAVQQASTETQSSPLAGLVRPQMQADTLQIDNSVATHCAAATSKANTAASTKSIPLQWSSLFSAKPNVQPKSDWKSLFANKPFNAGRYVSKRYDSLGDCNDVLVPPQSVVDAGVEFWKDTLVGFFLDNGYGFYRVKAFLMNKWKLRGSWKIRFDKDLFFIEFSNPEDRRLVLEADPCVIDGKVFIITKWSPNVDCARENILSIPVWAKFSSIPSSLQSLEGLDWLACHLGELVCFDENTESRERLVFARALIEITPAKPLPSHLTVALSSGRVGRVDIDYAWSPPICTFCHSFGHLETQCLHRPPIGVPVSIPAKIPIQKPQPRQWKVKCPSVPTPDVHAGLQSFISKAAAIVDTPIPPVAIDDVDIDNPDDTVAPSAYKGIFMVLDSDELDETAAVSDVLDSRSPAAFVPA